MRGIGMWDSSSISTLFPALAAVEAVEAAMQHRLLLPIWI